MDSAKYIGLDVHKESISIAVLTAAGKIVMECVIETKAITILEFLRGLRGELHITFQNPCSITWAGKQEKLRPPERCFFLTSSFIELLKTWPRGRTSKPWIL
jgi:hypothetical protein